MINYYKHLLEYKVIESMSIEDDDDQSEGCNEISKGEGSAVDKDRYKEGVHEAVIEICIRGWHPRNQAWNKPGHQSNFILVEGHIHFFLN